MMTENNRTLHYLPPVIHPVITKTMSQPTGAGDPLSSDSLGGSKEGADRVIYRVAAAGGGRRQQEEEEENGKDRRRERGVTMLSQYVV